MKMITAVNTHCIWYADYSYGDKKRSTMREPKRFKMQLLQLYTKSVVRLSWALFKDRFSISCVLHDFGLCICDATIEYFSVDAMSRICVFCSECSGKLQGIYTDVRLCIGTVGGRVIVMELCSFVWLLPGCLALKISMQIAAVGELGVAWWNGVRFLHVIANLYVCVPVENRIYDYAKWMWVLWVL